VMDLQTVAEFVETEKTRELITKIGVDYAQGHIIGKPIELDTVLADLSDLTKSSTG
jgi:EAL domain-containing protein (putative c-di-GMP-specific phosphodiesterase class I)